MKLVVVGAAGQLGTALVRLGRDAGHDVVGLTRDHLDLTRPDDIAESLAAAAGGLVINASAYTAVDRAESDEQTAYAVNTAAPAAMATACKALGARFVHVSTDYVFDGTSSRAYREDDVIAPLGVYGRSKADGEIAVREILPEALVVRTSWVFSATGANFVRTMLRLAKERDVLRVVADQHGCPTFAGDLARGLFELAAHPAATGLYHYCGSGPTTWHGFAEAIVDGARARGPVATTRIDAITTAEFPTPARRPANSILDTSRVQSLGITPAPWRAGLAHVLDEVFAT